MVLALWSTGLYSSRVLYFLVKGAGRSFCLGCSVTFAAVMLWSFFFWSRSFWLTAFGGMETASFNKVAPYFIIVIWSWQLNERCRLSSRYLMSAGIWLRDGSWPSRWFIGRRCRYRCWKLWCGLHGTSNGIDGVVSPFYVFMG